MARIIKIIDQREGQAEPVGEPLDSRCGALRKGCDQRGIVFIFRFFLDVGREQVMCIIDPGVALEAGAGRWDKARGQGCRA